MIQYRRAQPNWAPRAAKEPKGMAKAHWAEALRIGARAEISRGSIPNENRTDHPRQDRRTDNAQQGPTSAERGPGTGPARIRGGAIPPDSLREPTATTAGNLGTSAESALKPSNAINVAARAISPPTAPTKGEVRHVFVRSVGARSMDQWEDIPRSTMRVQQGIEAITRRSTKVARCRTQKSMITPVSLRVQGMPDILPIEVDALQDTESELPGAAGRSLLPAKCWAPAQLALQVKGAGEAPIAGGQHRALATISVTVWSPRGPVTMDCQSVYIWQVEVGNRLILGFPFSSAYRLALIPGLPYFVPVESLRYTLTPTPTVYQGHGCKHCQCNTICPFHHRVSVLRGHARITQLETSPPSSCIDFPSSPFPLPPPPVKVKCILRPSALAMAALRPCAASTLTEPTEKTQKFESETTSTTTAQRPHKQMFRQGSAGVLGPRDRQLSSPHFVHSPYSVHTYDARTDSRQRNDVHYSEDGRSENRTRQ